MSNPLTRLTRGPVGLVALIVVIAFVLMFFVGPATTLGQVIGLVGFVGIAVVIFLLVRGSRSTRV